MQAAKSTVLYTRPHATSGYAPDTAEGDDHGLTLSTTASCFQNAETVYSETLRRLEGTVCSSAYPHAAGDPATWEPRQSTRVAGMAQ